MHVGNGFEPAHLSLAPADRMLRYRCSMVLVLPGTVDRGRHLGLYAAKYLRSWTVISRRGSRTSPLTMPTHSMRDPREPAPGVGGYIERSRQDPTSSGRSRSRSWTVPGNPSRVFAPNLWSRSAVSGQL